MPLPPVRGPLARPERRPYTYAHCDTCRAWKARDAGWLRPWGAFVCDACASPAPPPPSPALGPPGPAQPTLF